jgi:hypothetical protein
VLPSAGRKAVSDSPSGNGSARKKIELEKGLSDYERQLLRPFLNGSGVDVVIEHGFEETAEATEMQRRIINWLTSNGRPEVEVKLCRTSTECRRDEDSHLVYPERAAKGRVAENGA